jgi:hypothetical protein
LPSRGQSAVGESLRKFSTTKRFRQIPLPVLITKLVTENLEAHAHVTDRLRRIPRHFLHRSDAAGFLRREPRPEISRFRSGAGAGAGAARHHPQGGRRGNRAGIATLPRSISPSSRPRPSGSAIRCCRWCSSSSRLCRDGLGEWCHWGATTQDITDTATVLQIREALDLIEADLGTIADALAGWRANTATRRWPAAAICSRRCRSPSATRWRPCSPRSSATSSA